MTEQLQYLAFMSFGPLEITVILIVAVLIFGRRLPGLARDIGKSLTEFKKGIREAKDTKDDLAKDVNQIKDDVTNEAKDAAGLNDSDKAQ